MPGGTTASQVAPFLRADIEKPLPLWSDEDLTHEGDDLVGKNKVTNTQSFIKLQQGTRPIAPKPVNPSESLPTGSYNKSYSATYSAQKYGLLLTFERELWKDNQYRSTIIGAYMNDLLDLCHDVRDQALVNEFFNLADTNLGPDGVAYIATNHPLEAEAAEFTDGFDGNTANTALYSNEIPNNPTASTAALNAGVSLLKRQRDSKGQIMAGLPPVQVECADAMEVIWRSIAVPVNGYEPFTTDRNSGKVYSAFISKVVGLTRATHAQRFILRAAKHRRFVWDRETPEVSELEYVKRNDTFRCNVIFRLAKGIFDWRYFCGSLAGS